MLLARKGKKKLPQTLITENICCHYYQKQRFYCSPAEKKVILFFFISEELGLVCLENSKIN